MITLLSAIVFTVGIIILMLNFSEERVTMIAISGIIVFLSTNSTQEIANLSYTLTLYLHSLGIFW
jgi:hypothetical protein